MNPALSTRELYNNSADTWRRDQPLLLSDFTARPRVLEVMGCVRGKEVWDLGCGEGYMGRALLRAGAALVRGYDISAEMIALAKATPTPGQAVFVVKDLADAEQWPEGHCDGALAVFLFNYLTLTQMEGVLAAVRKALRPLRLHPSPSFVPLPLPARGSFLFRSRRSFVCHKSGHPLGRPDLAAGWPKRSGALSAQDPGRHLRRPGTHGLGRLAAGGGARGQ